MRDVLYCDECGARLNLYVVGVCSRCHFDLTGEDEEQFKNDQWSKHQHVPLSAATAAEIAAEDVAKYDLMAAEATLTGFEGARFQDLYGVTLNAPGMGELLAMLRRSDEVNIDFDHGLRKANERREVEAPPRVEGPAE